MNYLGETIIFTGKIYNNENIVKNVRCELTLDQRNTNNNNIRIFYPDKDYKKIDEITKTNSIFIKSEMYGRKIFVKSSFIKHHINFESEPFLLLSAFEVVFEHNYSKKNIHKYSFSIHLTKSNVFRRKNIITVHATKGLLCGWKELKNNIHKSDDSEWEEEKFILPSPFDESFIIPGFVFQDLEESSYKVFNQLYLVIIIKNKINKNFDELEKEVFSYIDSLLKILSFVEGNYIRWFFLSTTFNGKLSEPILDRRMFKKIISPKKELTDEMYFLRNTEEYKKIIPNLFLKYFNLEEGKKEKLDKILDCFMISTTNDRIDTRIIYWRSCLDLIINVMYKQRGKNFNNRLILLCKKYDIEWEDLFPYVNKTDMPNKEKGFLINLIRINIIHNGEYPNDYKTVFYELYKVRALCERLILKYLGIDYKNTPFGIPHIEQTH